MHAHSLQYGLRLDNYRIHTHQRTYRKHHFDDWDIHLSLQ